MSEPFREHEEKVEDDKNQLFPQNMSFAAVTIKPPTTEPVAEGLPADILKLPLGDTIQDSDIPHQYRPQEFCAVPWKLRRPRDDGDDGDRSARHACGLSIHILRRLEFAFRISCIALLPCFILAYTDKTKDEWVVPFMVILPCIVAPNPQFGSTVRDSLNVLFGALLNLVMIELILLFDPARHWAAWGATYFVAVTLVALLTTGLATKLALFFFTVHMVLHFGGDMKIDGEKKEHLFPLHFLKPLSVGLGFALLQAIFPFPRFHKHIVDEQLSAALSSISICFRGLADSLWVDKSTQRESNLAHIKAIRSNINGYLAAATQNLEVMGFEPWSGTTISRCDSRLKLAHRLLATIDGMITLLVTLAKNPDIIDKSDRAQIWRENFYAMLIYSCDYVDEFLGKLQDINYAISESDMQKMKFMQCLLNRSYAKARFKAIMEDTSYLCDEHPERLFPFFVMGYQLFNFGNFIGIVVGSDYSDPPSRSIWMRLAMYPATVLLETWNELLQLFKGEQEQLLRLREAIKLSFTMTSAIALFLTRESHDPAGGAAVIGFMKDANPSINILGTSDFILGSVLGSVLGFLCATVTEDLTLLIAMMTALSLLTGFARTGTQRGLVGFVAMFFSLAGMAPGSASSDALVKTIQENVTAMLWLGVTHLVLWPTWPSDVLSRHMSSSLNSLRHIFCGMSQHIKEFNNDVSDLVTRATSLRACIANQFLLMSTAAAEPSLKKLPFPEAEGHRVLAALQNTVGIIFPVIEAISAALQRNERDLGSENCSAAWLMYTATEAHIDECFIVLNRLLKEIDTCLYDSSLQDAGADMTSLLLERQLEFTERSDELEAATLQTFFNFCRPQQNQRPLPPPFAIPAHQTIIHSVRLLSDTIKTLLMAVIEFRRKKSLRE